MPATDAIGRSPADPCPCNRNHRGGAGNTGRFFRVPADRPPTQSRVRRPWTLLERLLGFGGLYGPRRPLEGSVPRSARSPSRAGSLGSLRLNLGLRSTSPCHALPDPGANGRRSLFLLNAFQILGQTAHTNHAVLGIFQVDLTKNGTPHRHLYRGVRRDLRSVL